MALEPDEQLHILFAFDGERPDKDQVYDEFPYQADVGTPVVSNDEVFAQFLTAPAGGSVGVSDLYRFNLEVKQESIADTSGFKASQQERIEALLELVTALYGACDPRPGFVYALQHDVEAALKMYDDPAPADAASLAENRINHAVWLNIFPPRLVETYGREHLLEAPAWRTVELKDGAILVVAQKDPAWLVFDELNEHLGLEAP